MNSEKKPCPSCDERGALPKEHCTCVANKCPICGDVDCPKAHPSNVSSINDKSGMMGAPAQSGEEWPSDSGFLTPQEAAKLLNDRSAEVERLTKELDEAKAGIDFWQRELDNFRRNAVHRARQMAAEVLRGDVEQFTKPWRETAERYAAMTPPPAIVLDTQLLARAEAAEATARTLRELLESDASGRPVHLLLWEAAQALDKQGGGPLVDCLKIMSSQVESLIGNQS